jgi:peptidoglycan/LPS O-acetylase OafA/YrhL
MCFSLYCWHYWVMQATDRNSLQVNAAVTFLSVTVAVSLLTYKFIEFPRRTWRTLMRMESQQTFPVIRVCEDRDPPVSRVAPKRADQLAKMHSGHINEPLPDRPG